MMTYDQVFKYFEDNLNTLTDEYQLSKFGYNPCAIKTMNDLEKFIAKISTKYFDAKVKFLKDKYNHEKKRVYFEFEDQVMYLEIDSNYGHIELDHMKIVRFMGELSGNLICNVNPTGQLIIGSENDIIAAWKKGLPVHLPNFDFWYMNLSGERFNKKEIGTIIKINERVEGEFYLKEFIKALNFYMDQKKIKFTYTPRQIRICHGARRNTVNLIVSGAYSTEWTVKDDVTMFNNSFANQLFLNWLSKTNGDRSYVVTEKSGKELFEDSSIMKFISERKYKS